MKRFSNRARARWCLVLLGWLLSGSLAMAETGMTNSPSHWPSLSQVLQKWAAVPLDAVQRAATNGDLTAEHYLGYCYAEGLRVNKDTALGMEYYERAGKAGYAPSWNNLGVLYNSGNGVPQDRERAVYYFSLAADQGMSAAKVNLARVYLNSPAGADDPQKGVKILREAAEAGEARAMIWLYSIYWDGNGVATDHQEALRWLREAAGTGDAGAQCTMGWYYEEQEWLDSSSDGKRRPPNLPEAVRWYRQSAAQNWAPAQYELGRCYIKGLGVDQDEDRGLQLVRASADQNHIEAVYDLAGLYEQGIGEPRSEADRPDALLERVVAFDVQDQDNYYKIRLAYRDLLSRSENGVGRSRDLVEAARWYCRATVAGMDGFSLADKIETGPPHVRSGSALNGSWAARAPMGSLPDPGTGNRPFRAALSQYLKAAIDGNHAGLIQIGDRYLRRQDVPVSTPKAWLWYSLAAGFGVAGASEKAAGLEARMTPAELSEEKRLLPGLNQEFNSLVDALNRTIPPAGGTEP